MAPPKSTQSPTAVPSSSQHPPSPPIAELPANGPIPILKPQVSAPDLRDVDTILSNGEAKDASARLSPRAITPPSPSGSRSPHGKGRAGETGFATPPGRRSVQFARSPLGIEVNVPDNLPRDGSKDVSPVRDWRASALFNKLRAYASPSSPPMHRRRHSDYMIGSEPVGGRNGQFTPGTESEGAQLSDNTYDFETEDADNEGSESDEDEPESRPQRGRRPPMRVRTDSGTEPSTPRHTRATFFGRERRPGMPVRSSTTAMYGAEDRLGVSEDEGRRRTAEFRRMARDLRTGTFNMRREHRHTPSASRPHAIRRAFTAVAGTGDKTDGEATSPGPRRRERAAARMKGFKGAFRRKPKKPPTADQVKSAELVAELSAGVPAAIIFASMFQTDDSGHKRIPVLLEQLKVRLVKVVDDEKKKPHERHPSFHIQFEYGNGPTRMTWSIERSLADLYKLHLKYRTWANAQTVIGLRSNEKRIKLPHFPNRAFPYARALRGFGVQELSDSEEDVNQNAKLDTVHDQEKKSVQNERLASRNGEKPMSRGSGRTPVTPAPQTTESLEMTEIKPAEQNKLKPQDAEKQTVLQTPPATPRGHKKSRSANLDSSGQLRSPASPSFLRRKSSFAEGIFLSANKDNSGAVAGGIPQKSWPERQREMLEKYLQDMIRFMMFRPQNSRLCKFFELSALGIRLAAGGGYHGKEGPLIVMSHTKDLGNLRFSGRFSKWFLVRHSYIACVDSPEDITVTDVLMLDADFKFSSKRYHPAKGKPAEFATAVGDSATFREKHRLKLENSERRLNLLAKNSRLAGQFEASLKYIMETSVWSKRHRFDSFAPVRKNVFAQWLVDGRDHMWNLSRAISMAKDVIYIHDWWLSPELYLRRPAAIGREWRLDRLLKRKAEEGVRVFIIVYRNIESAIPIDSTYTKTSLLGLHPNIQVQRSPNQMRQGTFFWAHHEKLCIVDHTMAFVGGIDLCFGRWDTPQHPMTDNKHPGFNGKTGPKNSDHVQLWPGKDYSNPRVQDFYNLNEPYEEMYDRSKIPRMPWHDISMQLIGQPARDLTRHFVQRWNYILRQRKPSRPTPYLLPPPDFEESELAQLGVQGTCEVQLLRSAAMWSIGTPDRNECSIMTAYVKLIQESEHFVYIENQFFITSTRALGDRIENTIGDALVERIIRAARNDEAWRAVILIPLMPGFQNTVDSQDGTSIRLIMLCQYRSICRGENSIFGRLLREGIDPTDYIQFYGLRAWGKLGPNKALVTEQLYIHAKCMVVDDRSVIIGSANINERSLLGDRDSEVAAIVRDSDMMWSTMNDEPYEVSRFAHTLRMRLMREHLGIDVDQCAREELHADKDSVFEPDVDEEYAGSASDLYSEDDSEPEEPRVPKVGPEVLGELGSDEFIRPPYIEHAANLTAPIDAQSARGSVSPARRGRRATTGTVLSGKTTSSTAQSEAATEMGNPALPPPTFVRHNTYDLGLPYLSQLPALPHSDDTDIGGPGILRRSVSDRSTLGTFPPAVTSLNRPAVTKDCMKDPLSDHFYDNIWHAVAENNTVLFRTVFRCMPDNEVKTWAEYKESASYYERFQHSMGGATAEDQPNVDHAVASGPPGTRAPGTARSPNAVQAAAAGIVKLADGITSSKADNELERQASKETVPQHTDGLAELGTDGAVSAFPAPPDIRVAPEGLHHADSERTGSDMASTQDTAHLSPVTSHGSTLGGLPGQGPTSGGRPHAHSIAASLERGSAAEGGGSQRRRRRARSTAAHPTTASSSGMGRSRHLDDVLSRDVAEDILNKVQGHLIVWPYDWLIREEENDNWMYAVDAIAPLEIYN